MSLGLNLLNKLEDQFTYLVNAAAKYYNESTRTIIEAHKTAEAKEKAETSCIVNVEGEEFVAVEKPIGALEASQRLFQEYEVNFNTSKASLNKIDKELEEKRSELSEKQELMKNLNRDIQRFLLQTKQDVANQLESSQISPYLETTREAQTKKFAHVKSVESQIDQLKKEIVGIEEIRILKIEALKELASKLNKLKTNQERLQKLFEENTANTSKILIEIDALTKEEEKS